MKLTLKRIAFRPTYTIGKLYIDNNYFCDTLEDKNRDENRDGDLNDPGEEKVYGETAIPFGTYNIILNYSQKFKRILPRLLDVPHFDGILIHSGNIPEHTHGCILVGKNSQVGKVLDSKVTFDRLFNVMQEAAKNKEKIIIEIK